MKYYIRRDIHHAGGSSRVYLFVNPILEFDWKTDRYSATKFTEERAKGLLEYVLNPLLEDSSTTIRLERAEPCYRVKRALSGDYFNGVGGDDYVDSLFWTPDKENVTLTFDQTSAEHYAEALHLLFDYDIRIEEVDWSL